MENKNYVHYEKYNKKWLYRLNYYHNFNEKKGYYVLTKGKYKIVHCSISFFNMVNFIFENEIPFYSVHLNSMTLDDLNNYCDLLSLLKGKNRL